MKKKSLGGVFVIRKQTLGAKFYIIAEISVLMSLLSYMKNILQDGYFKDGTVKNMVFFCLLAFLLLIAVVVIEQIDRNDKIIIMVNLISGILRILSPILITMALASLIKARVEGLMFIYFTNYDTMSEIQTIENIASAKGAILTIICMMISVVMTTIGSFLTFTERKYVK